MVIEELPRNASLSEILHARAMHASKGRLGMDMLGGAIVAGAIAWARPKGWVVLLAAALCFLAYGAWATAERRLQPVEFPARIEHESAWRALHAACAFVGLAAFCLLLLAFLGLALGKIIS
jgi:hypothetical protein